MRHISSPSRGLSYHILIKQAHALCNQRLLKIQSRDDTTFFVVGFYKTCLTSLLAF